MRNPLAAAAIIALAGDGAGRDAVERTIRHYDYSKLHMSEFFFAECAYYALPKPQPWVATAECGMEGRHATQSRDHCWQRTGFQSIGRSRPGRETRKGHPPRGGRLCFRKAAAAARVLLGCSISPSFELKDKSKEEIDTYAESIRRQGYNLVRPHFLDTALTDGAKEDLEFNAEFLDRFEYFVSCLKDRGIYLYLDAMTSWKGYTKAKTWSKEGMAVQFKQRIYVEDAVRTHWEAGVRQLLTHLNSYTQTRLIDDPMVAVVLFFNEQNLNLFGSVPALLEKPWREFLARKYGTVEALRSAWVGENARPLTRSLNHVRHGPLVQAFDLLGTQSAGNRLRKLHH